MQAVGLQSSAPRGGSARPSAGSKGMQGQSEGEKEAGRRRRGWLCCVCAALPADQPRSFPGALRAHGPETTGVLAGHPGARGRDTDSHLPLPAARPPSRRSAGVRLEQGRAGPVTLKGGAPCARLPSGGQAGSGRTSVLKYGMKGVAVCTDSTAERGGRCSRVSRPGPSAARPRGLQGGPEAKGWAEKGGAERGAGRPTSPSLLLRPPSCLPPSEGRAVAGMSARVRRFFVSCVSRGVRHLCENDWHRRSEPDDPEAGQVLPGPGNSRLVPTSTQVAVSQRRSRNAQSLQLWGREEGRGPRQKWAGLLASAAPPAVKMLLSP